MHTVSPSQIAAADRCLRRWWWQSVKGFKSPTTPATEFGSQVHAALEFRLQNPHWPSTGFSEEVLMRARPVFYALVGHLQSTPFTLKGDLVELDWSLPAGADYPLPSRGRVDLVLPVRNMIVDWKTTSGTKYVKTSDELVTDPQVIMYSDALARQGIVTAPLDFLHAYTVTRGPERTVLVQTRVTPESLSIGRLKIAKTMQRMADVLALHNPTREDVQENILACSDFGGCPHRERCFGLELETEQEGSMNLAEKLAARKAAQAGTAEPVKVEAPVASAINSPETVQEEAPAPAPCVFVEPAAEPAKKSRKKAQPEPIEPEVDGDKPGDTLLVGAVPMFSFVNWQHFDSWVAPMVEQACDTLKVVHWTVAEFGKGKAAIVALVAAAAKAGKIPSHLIIDRRSALGDAVCEVLVPYYRNVFVKMG